MKATVSSKGQVTIPITIRSGTHIITGTQLDFTLEKDGTITIHPISNDIRKIQGIVKSKNKKPFKKVLKRVEMIGLDTNVIIRYLAQDDPLQTKKANDFIEVIKWQQSIFLIHLNR